ncbi:MAG TPA: YqgE/AlgH family protein [Gammaproteobacteria bacterium]|jgi:putative transcriptional regulator|nr:YqgE/AlgH family protein [Gammaproteobacteria bacterium]
MSRTKINFAAAATLWLAGIFPAAAAPPEPLSGHLLVAAPTMQDPRFHHAVILILEQDPGGAIGLIVNHRLGRVPLKALLKKMNAADGQAHGSIMVHYGGPVGLDQGFLVHSPDYDDASTIKLTSALSVSIDTDAIRSLAGAHRPKKSIFLLGYAGWGPGQLEDEIAAGAWFVVPPDAGLVFGPDSEAVWEQAVAKHKVTL